MSDEFRLKPVDVRNQEFRRSMRGCDPAEVEEFKGRVADELERQLRDRAGLEERERNYREQLKAFREREKAMNEALVAAQQLRADAEKAAQREVDGMVQEAQKDAEQILAQAKQAETNLQRDTAAGQRQFSGYLAGFRALLERQLSEVEALEARDRDNNSPGSL